LATSSSQDETESSNSDESFKNSFSVLSLNNFRNTVHSMLFFTTAATIVPMPLRDTN
jgi:hypothetical protein